MKAATLMIKTLACRVGLLIALLLTPLVALRAADAPVSCI